MCPTPKPHHIRGCWTNTSPHGRSRSVGARAQARVIPDWGMGVVVLSLECVLCDTGTATPCQRRLCILHAERPRLRRCQKKTVSSLYVLGWCICQDKPYITIIVTTISFRAKKDNLQVMDFYVISCMIVFMLPLWYNCTFSSLSLTIQLEKNIFQVINYNWIKTIESKPTFGKSSILNQ